MNIGNRGTFANLGIPGTGLSYRQKVGGLPQATPSAPSAAVVPGSSRPKFGSAFLVLMLLVGGIFAASSLFGRTSVRPPARTEVAQALQPVVWVAPQEGLPSAEILGKPRSRVRQLLGSPRASLETIPNPHSPGPPGRPTDFYGLRRGEDQVPVAVEFDANDTAVAIVIDLDGAATHEAELRHWAGLGAKRNQANPESEPVASFANNRMRISHPPSVKGVAQKPGHGNAQNASSP